MQNAWDIPPPPAEGDEFPHLIYEAVGRALSQWEELEQTLAALYAFFVSIGTQIDFDSPATRAYGTIVGFTGRKDMLDAAAKTYFHSLPAKQDEENYAKLINTVARFSARRNEIAHGCVTHDGKGWVLRPASYNSRKNPLNNLPTYTYGSKEIGHLRRSFRTLHVEASGVLIVNLRTTAPPRP
jgi:hypothetical protein